MEFTQHELTLISTALALGISRELKKAKAATWGPTIDYHLDNANEYRFLLSKIAKYRYL